MIFYVDRYQPVINVGEVGCPVCLVDLYHPCKDKEENDWCEGRIIQALSEKVTTLDSRIKELEEKLSNLKITFREHHDLD